MLTITERNDRLILEFSEPKPLIREDGTIDVGAGFAVTQTIDITAHIERAVRNVLGRNRAFTAAPYDPPC